MSLTRIGRSSTRIHRARGDGRMARMLSEEETIVLYKDLTTIAPTGPEVLPSQTPGYLCRRVTADGRHVPFDGAWARQKGGWRLYIACKERPCIGGGIRRGPYTVSDDLPVCTMNRDKVNRQ